MKKALAAAAIFAGALSIGPLRRRLEERWPPWLRPALLNGTARYREFTRLASQQESNGALDPLVQSALEQDLQQPEGGTLGELLMLVGDLEQNSLDFARLDPETVTRFQELWEAYIDIEAALRRPVFSLPEFDLNGPRDGATMFASRVYWVRRLYFSLTHLTRYLAMNGERTEAAQVLETLLLWSKSGLRTPNPLALPAFKGLQGRVLRLLAEPWALQALATRGGWDALSRFLLECSAGGQGYLRALEVQMAWTWEQQRHTGHILETVLGASRAFRRRQILGLGHVWQRALEGEPPLKEWTRLASYCDLQGTNRTHFGFDFHHAVLIGLSTVATLTHLHKTTGAFPLTFPQVDGYDAGDRTARFSIRLPHESRYPEAKPYPPWPRDGRIAFKNGRVFFRWSVDDFSQ